MHAFQHRVRRRLRRGLPLTTVPASASTGEESAIRYRGCCCREPSQFKFPPDRSVDPPQRLLHGLLTVNDALVSRSHRNLWVDRDVSSARRAEELATWSGRHLVEQIVDARRGTRLKGEVGHGLDRPTTSRWTLWPFWLRRLYGHQGWRRGHLRSPHPPRSGPNWFSSITAGGYWLGPTSRGPSPGSHGLLKVNKAPHTGPVERV
jgi:hypothetical protein